MPLINLYVRLSLIVKISNLITLINHIIHAYNNMVLNLDSYNPI